MPVSTYEWVTRCIPALSICAVAVLLVSSFVLDPYGKGEKGRHYGQATWTQLLLSFYTVGLHILAISFPFRVCWAMGDIIARIKEEATILPATRRRRVLSIKNEQGISEFPVPMFVVIIPAYKEETDTLEETLRVLASHPQARLRYHVYLAMEEKEEKSAIKAAGLCNSFERSFFRMSYTIHPANIPGEAQGKSSNEAWAAKQAIKDYPDRNMRQNIIFTTMDADTHLSFRYFEQVSRLHIECLETNQTTIYVPPLVFDRNLHRVPLPVRTADLMWAGAGLSSLYAGSSVCIPTSVYSLPMSLVEFVGGWDTGPGAIGEDMHMYLKCFFALSGNLKVQVIYAPASQCNVSSDVKGFHGYLDGLYARYRQALRHMWGSMDTGYAVRATIDMFTKHRAIETGHIDLPLSAPNSNWTAFYTSTGLHHSLSAANGKIPSDGSSGDNTDDEKRADSAISTPGLRSTPPPQQPATAVPVPTLPTMPSLQPKPIHTSNLWILCYRLFEAHFLPTHLATILTASGIYTALYPRFLIPTALRLALDFSGWCRLLSFCTMLGFFYRYEQYHRICVALRREEMTRAGLLEDLLSSSGGDDAAANKHGDDGFTPEVFQVAGLFEVALFPIGGFLFGAIPALHAVLSHLFTDRLTYVVSLKPQLGIRNWREVAGMAAP